MVPRNQPLSPNTDAVAAEVIDGEAIIVNLATGVYYSLAGVGGSIWALIEAGLSPEDIEAAIAARYDISRERARSDVRRLVAELVRQNLVVSRDPKSPSRTDPEPLPEQKLPYDTPKLDTFRDMGELLALDPPMPGLQDIPWTAPADKRLD